MILSGKSACEVTLLILSESVKKISNHSEFAPHVYSWNNVSESELTDTKDQATVSTPFSILRKTGSNNQKNKKA